MAPKQANPLQRNPNAVAFTQVATYRRLIEASLERVWENVLDWEHLPHLHDSSFSYCELDDNGDWGWRTWSNPEHTDHIELCVGLTDYVARTYSGGEQVSEIWTTLAAEDQNTRIEVEFLVADVTADQSAMMGELFLSLYAQLWDEDESMMRSRQQRLSETRSLATSVDLGDSVDVRKNLPLVFELRRQEFMLINDQGELRAEPTICPHLLGPLEQVPGAPEQLRCPWHGYVFDTRSRDCLQPATARCRLPRAPDVATTNGRIIASIN